MNPVLKEIQKKITPVLKEYKVEYAAVFGSVARGRDTAESDVDMVVRIQRLPHGIWGFVGLKQDLEKALNKRVDLISEQGMGREFFGRIKDDLVMVYEQ